MLVLCRLTFVIAVSVLFSCNISWTESSFQLVSLVSATGICLHIPDTGSDRGSDNVLVIGMLSSLASVLVSLSVVFKEDYDMSVLGMHFAVE